MGIEEIRLLTAKDLAKALGVNVQALATWRFQGVGPKYLKIGKRVYYKQADVLAWLDETRERTQS